MTVLKEIIHKEPVSDKGSEKFDGKQKSKATAKSTTNKGVAGQNVDKNEEAKHGTKRSTSETKGKPSVKKNKSDFIVDSEEDDDVVGDSDGEDFLSLKSTNVRQVDDKLSKKDKSNASKLDVTRKENLSDIFSDEADDAPDVTVKGKAKNGKNKAKGQRAVSVSL